MIQIIKNGKYMEHRIHYELTCDKCGCIFRFDKEDVKNEYRNGDFRTGPQLTWDIKCPYCNGWITKRKYDITEIQEEVEISGDKNEKM